MTDKTEHLLNAEQILNDLVGELEELKLQVGGYGEAKLTLSEAGDGLSGVANSLQSLCVRLESVSSTLREIGTPEILDGQVKILHSQQDIYTSTATEHKELRDALQKATRRLGGRSIFNSLLSVLALIGIGVLIARSFGFLMI